MTVQAIWNGHYRSATSFVNRMLWKGNPEMITIYEPCSKKKTKIEKVINGEKEPGDFGDRGTILNYFRLPDYCLKRYWKTNAGTSEGVYDKHEGNKAKTTLKPLYDCNENIILQTNRLHMVLNEISDYLDCNYVHVIRHPLNCFIAHTGKKMRTQGKIEPIFKDFANNKKKGMVGYSIHRIYQMVSRKYWNPKVEKQDWMSKWLIAWSYVNDIAMQQVENSERGMAIQVEDIFSDFEDIRKEISEHLGVNLSEEVFNERFNPNRAFKKSPEYLSDGFFERMEKLKVEENCPCLYNFLDLKKW